MTGKPTLDDIAPYPAKEEDATAKAMTAHFAAFSLMHQTMALNGAFDADRDKYMRSIGFAVSYYGLAHLLREVQGRAGVEAADAVARDLWLAWEDGSSLGEWCWEWLSSYGVDPEAVQKVADRLAAEEAAKPAETEVRPGQKTSIPSGGES